MVLKRAWGLAELLHRMTLLVERDDLLAGFQSSILRAAPIFPEYSIDWLLDEIDEFEKRDGDRFLPTLQQKDDIRRIHPYWHGNTLQDHAYSLMSERSLEIENSGTAISYTIQFVTDGGTAIANQTYTIESTGTLPTTTKTGYAFQGWTVAATNAGDPIGWEATANKSASLAGKYGNVTLTAQWKLAVTAQLFDYWYAPSGYQLLVVSGDSANYSYGGADMYYTTEAAYKSLIDGDEGVYLYLVETSAYAESSIAISDNTRTTLERSGDVNGDSTVDIADANAVYRMIQNPAQGNYYTLTQVNILGRLVADMDADYDKNVPYGASIADVQAILNKING